MTGDLLKGEGIEPAVDGAEVIRHLARGPKGDDVLRDLGSISAGDEVDVLAEPQLRQQRAGERRAAVEDELVSGGRVGQRAENVADRMVATYLGPRDGEVGRVPIELGAIGRPDAPGGATSNFVDGGALSLATKHSSVEVGPPLFVAEVDRNR